MPLTNDTNTEAALALGMKVLTGGEGRLCYCPGRVRKENKPWVSPDPFEETLEDEKGSLDSKGSS